VNSGYALIGYEGVCEARKQNKTGAKVCETAPPSCIPKTNVKMKSEHFNAAASATWVKRHNNGVQFQFDD